MTPQEESKLRIDLFACQQGMKSLTFCIESVLELRGHELSEPIKTVLEGNLRYARDVLEKHGGS